MSVFPLHVFSVVVTVVRVVVVMVVVAVVVVAVAVVVVEVEATQERQRTGHAARRARPKGDTAEQTAPRLPAAPNCAHTAGSALPLHVSAGVVVAVVAVVVVAVVDVVAVVVVVSVVVVAVVVVVVAVVAVVDVVHVPHIFGQDTRTNRASSTLIRRVSGEQNCSFKPAQIDWSGAPPVQ